LEESAYKWIQEANAGVSDRWKRLRFGAWVSRAQAAFVTSVDTPRRRTQPDVPAHLCDVIIRPKRL